MADGPGRRRLHVQCRFCGHEQTIWTRAGLHFQCKKCLRRQEGPEGLKRLPVLKDPLDGNPKPTKHTVRKLRVTTVTSGPSGRKVKPPPAASPPPPAPVPETPAPAAPAVTKLGIFDRMMGFGE